MSSVRGVVDLVITNVSAVYETQTVTCLATVQLANCAFEARWHNLQYITVFCKLYKIHC